MQCALGTVHGGRIELTVPEDWPDGLRVEVKPIFTRVGISEADYPMTPESISALLSQMVDAAKDCEPVEFNFDWNGWDEFQKESVQKSWEGPLR